MDENAAPFREYTETIQPKVYMSTPGASFEGGWGSSLPLPQGKRKKEKKKEERKEKRKKEKKEKKRKKEKREL